MTSIVVLVRKFLQEILILVQNFDFWKKFRFFEKKFDFLKTFRYLSKITILEKKISIFEQNSDIWTKLRFWTKFDFLTKLRFLNKISFSKKRKHISNSWKSNWSKNHWIWSTGRKHISRRSVCKNAGRKRAI